MDDTTKSRARAQPRAGRLARIPGLGRRGARVLRGVVRGHVTTGEPVGSAAAVRHGKLDISSATARAVMVDLTRAGLLVQPHASAGRIPTPSGWRVYVDHLMPRKSLASADRDGLAEALGDSIEPELLLRAALRHLASSCAAPVVGRRPQLDQARVERLQLMPLEAGRAIAVWVMESGVVRHHLVALGDHPPSALQRAQNLFNSRWSGVELHVVRSELRALATRPPSNRDDAQDAPLLGIAARALPPREDAHGAVIVEGQTHLLSRSGAEDGVAQTLCALTDPGLLLRLLDAFQAEDGAAVSFGAELDLPEIQGCTVVAATYGVGGRRLGTLAIVAPVRMDYARIVPWVGYAARALSQSLGDAA